MPKRARELSPIEVSRLSEPGFHAVGVIPGLYLKIGKGDARSWILRTMVGVKRRDIGLGSYPAIKLAAAREKAREARETIEQGRDPVAERQEARQRLMVNAAKSVTFDECARKLLEKKQPEFRNAKHAAQWSTTLAVYASPVIGKLPVASIELGHITSILDPIWTTKTETATRVRGRIESVIDYGIANGWRTAPNPARWKANLDAVLAKPGKLKAVRHHKALPYSDVPELIVELGKRQGTSARALLFLIYTAARSGEIRGASWTEIDLANQLWTIPPDRMKAQREHRVPLSDAAIELLGGLKRMAGSDLLFPNTSGNPLSDMALTKLLRDMEAATTAHGLRSSFRDWATERTNYPEFILEMALAHTVSDKVLAAYRRTDLLEKRRRLMADWARFCLALHAEKTVVAFDRKRLSKAI